MTIFSNVIYYKILNYILCYNYKKGLIKEYIIKYTNKEIIELSLVNKKFFEIISSILPYHIKTYNKRILMQLVQDPKQESPFKLIKFKELKLKSRDKIKLNEDQYLDPKSLNNDSRIINYKKIIIDCYINNDQSLNYFFNLLSTDQYPSNVKFEIISRNINIFQYFKNISPINCNKYIKKTTYLNDSDTSTFNHKILNQLFNFNFKKKIYKFNNNFFSKLLLDFIFKSNSNQNLNILNLFPILNNNNNNNNFNNSKSNKFKIQNIAYENLLFLSKENKISKETQTSIWNNIIDNLINDTTLKHLGIHFYYYAFMGDKNSNPSILLGLRKLITNSKSIKSIEISSDFEKNIMEGLISTKSITTISCDYTIFKSIIRHVIPYNNVFRNINIDATNVSDGSIDYSDLNLLLLPKDNIKPDIDLYCLTIILKNSSTDYNKLLIYLNNHKFMVRQFNVVNINLDGSNSFYYILN